MNSKKAKVSKSKAVFHPVLGMAGKNYNKKHQFLSQAPIIS